MTRSERRPGPALSYLTFVLGLFGLALSLPVRGRLALAGVAVGCALISAGGALLVRWAILEIPGVTFGEYLVYGWHLSVFVPFMLLVAAGLLCASRTPDPLLRRVAAGS